MDSHADKLHPDSLRHPLDSKPVSPSMFAHFVLRTANRGPLRDWYLKVLNARQVFENEYISFITYDDDAQPIAARFANTVIKSAKRLRYLKGRCVGGRHPARAGPLGTLATGKHEHDTEEGDEFGYTGRRALLPPDRI